LNGPQKYRSFDPSVQLQTQLHLAVSWAYTPSYFPESFQEVHRHTSRPHQILQEIFSSTSVPTIGNVGYSSAHQYL
ncbi:hypothetical protein Tco_0102301, partial [Tanacetum coccineum]